MVTTCKGCNTVSSGMVNIFSHPNNIDVMFSETTGIEVRLNDHLCILCYDEMKIANNFRQKCIQWEMLRMGSTKTEKEDEITTTSIIDDELEVELIEPLRVNQSDEDEVVESSDLIEKSNEIESLAVSSDEPSAQPDEETNNTDQIDSKDVPFTCGECNKTFLRLKNYNKHIQTHSPKQISDVEEIVVKRKKRGPATKFPEEDIFTGLHPTQCVYCFAEFTNITERESHEIQHQSEDKPYKCTFTDCNSQFKGKCGLRSHYRIHSDVKRFKCMFCEHRFHQRGNLQSHERLHTGEKPFLCPHCGKSFAESGNLKAHIRFHTGERPYPCSQCPKRFKTHYSHKIHERSHTQERPYLCSECGKRFFSSGKLLVHKRTHTGQRPYSCTVCPAAFMDSSGLKRHSRIHN